MANLARLELTPEEAQRFQSQLSRVLDAMAELAEVDTSAVEPTSHATFAEQVLREDVARPSLGVDRALQNAPQRIDSSFAVPKIIE